MDKDLNRPKFFYNFVGPESDSIEYVAEAPQTELSLGVGDVAGAVKEVNLLGAMERVWVDLPPPPSTEAQARRRIAVMRRDKLAARREAEKRLGYDPNLIQLMRPVERDPTFLLPAPVEFIRSVEMGPPPPPSMIVFGREKGLSIGGGGSLGTEQREAAANASNKPPAAMVAVEPDHVKQGGGGSSSANPNPNKKMKQVCVETSERERLIFPKPMYAPGPGSGSNDVILLKGYLSKGSDEQVRIVCTCHNHPHTPEEFVNHSGGTRSRAGDQPCFVTVSRGDSSSFIHARR